MCFTLDGDPMHRGKVRNLIEPIKTYRPKKMEIWVFRDYHTVMRRNSFSSNDDMRDDCCEASVESSESEILQPIQPSPKNIAGKRKSSSN